MQRLGDEPLGDVRAVAIGGVDEVDPELERALEHRDRGIVVARRAPDALARDPHRAEAEAVDLDVATDREHGHVCAQTAQALAGVVPVRPAALRQVTCHASNGSPSTGSSPCAPGAVRNGRETVR